MAPKTWAIRRSNGNRYDARAVRYINRRSYVVLFPGQTAQPTPLLRVRLILDSSVAPRALCSVVRSACMYSQVLGRVSVY
ncbi:hypothetical protein J3E68DRAFT_392267 [Trichoderma sp. SZMC 28012]